MICYFYWQQLLFMNQLISLQGQLRLVQLVLQLVLILGLEQWSPQQVLVWLVMLVLEIRLFLLNSFFFSFL